MHWSIARPAAGGATFTCLFSPQLEVKFRQWNPIWAPWCRHFRASTQFYLFFFLLLILHYFKTKARTEHLLFLIKAVQCFSFSPLEKFAAQTFTTNLLFALLFFPFFLFCFAFFPCLCGSAIFLWHIPAISYEWLPHSGGKKVCFGCQNIECNIKSYVMRYLPYCHFEFMLW